jgi:hypothetical protein
LLAAGGQSSPPGMPSWNILIGRIDDCVSPVQARVARPSGPGGRAMINTAAETTTVVALPHPNATHVVVA